MRRLLVPFILISLSGALWSQQEGQETPRVPRGIYAAVIVGFEVIKSANNVHAAHPEISADQAMTNFFSVTLSNRSASGLLLDFGWNELNPGDPGPDPEHPAPGAYAWNFLDDGFQAAIASGEDDDEGRPTKTVQLVIDPGFQSPEWLFDKYLTSCDGLFMTTPQPYTSTCDFTYIFRAGEIPGGLSTEVLRFPLPWSTVYQAKWRQFLQALNRHIQSNPLFSRTFVSIGVAGPTAMSEEMILPGDGNQAEPLTLPAVALPSGDSSLSIPTANEAWNILLGNRYGASAPEYNSDRAIVDAWKVAIDAYSQVFSGITLDVSTAGQLPEFAVPSGSPLLIPAQGFAPDCGTFHTVDCAAETSVLAYFSDANVGGFNAKSTQEDGLRADGINSIYLGQGTVKWLSHETINPGTILAGGTAPLSRMLGGLQSAGPVFTQPQQDGCVVRDCSPPPSPEQGFFNFLAAFFAGTSVGGYYGAPADNNNQTIFTNAPINYLQIYWQDFAYAAGLNGCSMEQIMTARTEHDPILDACRAPLTHVTLANGLNTSAQQELQTASEQILRFTSEPPAVPPGH